MRSGFPAGVTALLSKVVKRLLEIEEQSRFFLRERYRERSVESGFLVLVRQSTALEQQVINGNEVDALPL